MIPIEKARPKKAAKKLSYKDQRELDALPAEIETLTHRINQMEAMLADPDLYATDPGKFQRISDKMTAEQGELEEKEMRWLELEELKAELEG